MIRLTLFMAVVCRESARPFTSRAELNDAGPTMLDMRLLRNRGVRLPPLVCLRKIISLRAHG